MVTGGTKVFGCAANFLRGRKCIYCGSFKVNRTARGYVKCQGCGQQKSAKRLRRKIAILQGFYQQVPAYRLASDLGVDAKVVSRVYQRLRRAMPIVAYCIDNRQLCPYTSMIWQAQWNIGTMRTKAACCV